MTEAEYKDQLKLLDSSFHNAKLKLANEFVNGNAKFKIGDTIKDGRYAFVIDEINIYLSYGLPVPVYRGFELKKDLTPRKDKNRVGIYGDNAELIKKVN